jgi:hypothetical protein
VRFNSPACLVLFAAARSKDLITSADLIVNARFQKHLEQTSVKFLPKNGIFEDGQRMLHRHGLLVGAIGG